MQAFINVECDTINACIIFYEYIFTQFYISLHMNLGTVISAFLIFAFLFQFIKVMNN